MKIAIIGAGFSACFLYKNLSKHDVNITLFEKSRGTGGRLSTKYLDDKLIDHGTPFIETKNKDFNEFLEENVKNGILRKVDNSFIPTKGINKLCSSLIDKSDFVKQTRIIEAKFSNNKWHLKDEKNKEYNEFDKIFLAIPSEQVLQMNIDLEERTRKLLESVKYDSIASLICYTNNKSELKDEKLLGSTFFKKIIDNSSKYDYKDFSSYVFHVNKEFSNKYNELSKDEIFQLVDKKIEEMSAIDIKKDFEIIQHLWKYAFVKDGINKDFIYDNKNIGFCGDYFNGNNLEAAYNSSRKLYEKISLELS